MRQGLSDGICRAYFALLAIMPPIILVLVAFLVFTVPKADYSYRLLAHVLLLLPMLLCQVLHSHPLCPGTTALCD